MSSLPVWCCQQGSRLPGYPRRRTPHVRKADCDAPFNAALSRLLLLTSTPGHATTGPARSDHPSYRTSQAMRTLYPSHYFLVWMSTMFE
jgi:hypothetical protein